MALNQLHLLIFEEIRENVDNHFQQRIKFRMIRDQSNPFGMPEKKFIKLFRLSREAALRLIDELAQFEPAVEKRRDSVPFFLQVLACFHFYGHGSYQVCVGDELNLGMSQPVVSRVLAKISSYFAQHLLVRYVKFPRTIEEMNAVKIRFLQAFEFPNILGAIDCTHIALIGPTENAIAYLNRKGFYSLNVQMICDADMVIRNVNALYPGATHDAAIWELSAINRFLSNRYQMGERNTWLIGDSGYPLQPWLLTPIPDANPNTAEAYYTERHCRARNIVERTFGVLKNRFRCLLKHRVLHYSHASAGQIIYACVVLHNICRMFNVPEELNDDCDEDDDDDHNDNNDSDEEEPGIANGNVLQEGRLVRRGVVNWIRNNQ